MESKSRAQRRDRAPSPGQTSGQAASRVETFQPETSNAAIMQRARLAPGSLTPHDVLHLQRTIGNRAVGDLLLGPGRRRSPGSAPQIRRKLEAIGNDRFHGDVTRTDYKFHIEPEEEEDFEGPDGETVTAKFDERPVFIDESSDDHLAVATVAIREKEKLAGLFQRLGISYSGPVEGGTVSGPGKVDDTNTARKGLILRSYLDVIDDKKAKFQAAEEKPGEKWTKALEDQLLRLRGLIASKDNLVGWQVLKTLLKNINKVQGVKGAAPVKMNSEEKEAILKAVPEARSRAFTLITGLFSDAEGIKREFRTTDEADVAKVKSNLQKIAVHILQLKPEQILLDEDGTLAFNRGGAVNSGVGGKSSIKFSVHWLSHSLDRRAAELIHEASHGTEGVETKDLAYLGYWADAIIKGKSAVINAPTYERAAMAQAAKKAGEPAPAGKSLAINEDQVGQTDRLVKVLGKIDFHVTQAWWFVNNVSNFAKKIPADAELKKDKTDTGYTWRLFQSRHTWVAKVCAQIGSPVAKSQSGRTVFTPVDQELLNLYVRCLAEVKDAVDAIKRVDVVADAPATTIDKDTVHLPSAVLGRGDEQIQEWVTNEVALATKVPVAMRGASFYANVLQASGWKDSVEPGVDKSGV